MKTAIIVPARLGSSRFPQKLLQEVEGKPLLLWTAERIKSEAPEYPLLFAVDGEALKSVLTSAGFDAVVTDPALPSGTDRIAVANREIQASRVINVQADEPMVTGNQIRLLDQLLSGDIGMATLGTPLRSDHDYRNPNHVKMVCGRNGHALYFSRAPIPYIRETQGRFDPEFAGPDGVLIHVGLYAYTAEFLELFSNLQPGTLEQLEKLEMFRVLENGYRIATGVTHESLIEIDTPENLIEFKDAVTSRFNPNP